MKPKTLSTLLLLLIGLVYYSCRNYERQNSAVKADLTQTDSLSINRAFLKVDTLHQIPDTLKGLIKGQIKTVLQVDFDGDGKPDFICQYEPTYTFDSSDYLQDWITSGMQVVKREKKYIMDFDFFWLVNLDNDPEPEIFSASGYEDGIDYAFYDQDFKTGKDKLLFYFNPVIIENNNHFWGYPWDIRDIIIKATSTNIYLKASTDHDIERDENITISDSKKKFPAIFFYGKTTQPDNKVEAIRNIRWATLKELK